MIGSGLPGLGVLVLTALYAARSDLRDRRLSNNLCLTVAIAGLGQLLVSNGPSAAASGAAHAALALVLGAGLYALGGLGAGDVKYYAAVACWFSLHHAFSLLAAVSLAGLVLAGGWLLAARLRALRSGVRDSGDHSLLPFGVAIAAGAVFTASTMKA